MANLFIVGNGFDSAHILPTSYADFRQYLTETYPNADSDRGCYTPWSSTMPDGDEQYDDDEVVSTILYLIDCASDDKWSDLEYSLGHLNYKEFFAPFTLRDDDKEYHDIYNNQDSASNLLGAVRKMILLFSEWIETIDVSPATAKPDFQKLIETENNYFLTFNYTPTLEEVYNLCDICHIHGAQGEALFFGHGDNSDVYEEYESGFTGAESSISELHKQLQKNTQNALANNRDFFNALTNIDKFYSFGFSFADVDLVYIEEICNKIDTSGVIWYLNDFDSKKDIVKFVNKILHCGFKGAFDVYHIA